jgi:RNA polymerase sigma-70 factor, ECF subfamily
MRTSPFAPLRALFGGTDEQAMNRVRENGDEQAFAQLVRRWEVPIHRLCTRMIGDHHRGEDLTQDTFVRVFARRKEYQPSGRFSSWLWRIALNLCHDELRRRHRHTEAPVDEDVTVDETDRSLLSSMAAAPDEAAANRDLGDIIRHALDRLPEPYRAVLVLRHYENLKFHQIAEVLQIPEGTVKSRMAEALNRMQRLLQPLLGVPVDSVPHAAPQQNSTPVAL